MSSSCSDSGDATETPRRSDAEVEDLKGQWLGDPCWDIETTEGFEAHYAELLAYREAVEDQHKKLAEEDLRAWAAKNCAGNTSLARYLQRREAAALRAMERESRLAERIDALEEDLRATKRELECALDAQRRDLDNDIYDLRRRIE